jgi:hypothetical protein
MESKTTEVQVIQKDEIEKLDTKQKGKLKKLEKQISNERSKILNSFLAVGAALHTINNDKLYVEHKTFEKYCQQKWEFSRKYGYYLIDAFKVHQQLLTIVDKNKLQKLTNESHYRELNQLENKEGQAKVLEYALEQNPDQPITAKKLKEVRLRLNVETGEFNDEPIVTDSIKKEVPQKFNLVKGDIEITQNGLSFEQKDKKITAYFEKIKKTIAEDGTIQVICIPKK